MVFKTLKKKDYKKAIQYAVVGMHFNWYMNNPSLLKLYGRYFLYMELNRATQVIAAYEGDDLAGRWPGHPGGRLPSRFFWQKCTGKNLAANPSENKFMPGYFIGYNIYL